MEKAKFEQVREGAYFLVDPLGFQTTITSYDPLVANQTILFSWGAVQLGQQQLPPIEVQEIHRETEAPC